jgi:hypothetical protein
LDQIDDDLTNQRDVMSDTLEITKDIFTILYQSYTAEFGGFSIDYEPLWGPNATPFLERFETILGGWTLNLTIEQPFDYNTCVLPFTGLTLPTSVNYVNYKQIINDFEEIADAHLQINSFGYGDLEQLTNDIQTKVEPLYTRMYVIPDIATLAQNEMTYNFQIIIADTLGLSCNLISGENKLWASSNTSNVFFKGSVFPLISVSLLYNVLFLFCNTLPNCL